MKEYCIIFEFANYPYPFETYVTKDKLQDTLDNINSLKSHRIVEWHEI